MAYTDKSAWNPTQSAYGIKPPKEPTDATGLTNKQKDMSLARNPMNFNKQNVANPQGEKPPPIPQQVDKAAQEALNADVQQLQKKIGGAAYQVQGLVNQFLKTGTAQAGIKTNVETVYDPASGTWKSKNALPQDYDVSAAVKEKTAQLENIKKAASPYYEQDATGNWRAKSLENTMRDTYNYNSLPADQKTKVDSLIGLASMINQYENRGQGNSAEASALREQLQQMDQNGVVSGMYKAIDEYQKFAGTGTTDKPGMKWYGDEGDEGIGISELMSMDSAELEKELRAAVTTGSGVFGGDYESNLKRQIDTESQEARAGAAEEVEYRNKLLQASQQYFKGSSDVLQQNAEDIQKAFASAAPDIIKQMDQSPAGKAARDFFTQLSTAKPKEFADLISTLLTDPNSGLGTKQREVLRDMLGEMAGGKGSGKIQNWVDQLGRQGYIEATDPETGITSKIELNAEEKYGVLSALQLNKPEKVKEILENRMQSTVIGKDITTALDVAKLGNLPKAVAAFGTSIAQSLNTFATSKTEDAVRNSLGISNEDWRKMDANQKAVAISGALAENPKLVMESVISAATIKENAFRTAIGTAKDEITKFTSGLNEKKNKIASVRDKIAAKDAELTTYVQGYLNNTVVSNMYTNLAKYQDYFKQYDAQFTSIGVTPIIRTQAAEALSIRDALRNLKTKSPEMWSAINQDPALSSFVDADPNSAMSLALDSKNRLWELSKRFLTDLSQNANGVAERVISTVPALKEKKASIADMVARANTEMGKIDSLLAPTTAKLTHLAELEKSIGAKMFSPDEISKLALEVGRSFEATGTGVMKSLDLGKGYKSVGTEDIGKVIPSQFDMESTPISETFGETSYSGTPFGEGAGAAEQTVASPHFEIMLKKKQQEIAAKTQVATEKMARDLKSLAEKFPHRFTNPAENAKYIVAKTASVGSMLDSMKEWFKDMTSSDAEKLIAAQVKEALAAKGLDNASIDADVQKWINESVPSRGTFTPTEQVEGMTNQNYSDTSSTPPVPNLTFSPQTGNTAFGPIKVIDKPSGSKSSDGKSSGSFGGVSAERTNAKGKN